MAVRSLKIIRPKVWIPPIFSANWKLTVERKDGTIDDLTDIISSLEIEDGMTDVIGGFEFELWNPNETYTKVWTGNEIVRYYSDYATEATTLRFRGRIEKPSNQGNKIKVTGRSEAKAVMDITVTQAYENLECRTIFETLFGLYAPQFTPDFGISTDTSGVSLTINWYQKPFWDCIKELCTAAGFDAYINAELVPQFFLSSSRTNTEEAIVHEHNLIEVGDFARDSALIKNRIIVYGAEQEGIQIIYTAEDLSSQSEHGIKEEIVSDNNVTSYQQAKDLGDFLLTEKSNPPIVGEITGVLLASIQPGEKIYLSSPMENIPPNSYEIISYKHSIGDDGLTTTVRVAKEPRRISHIFQELIERSNQSQQTFSNPKEMRYSFNFLFDGDSGDHTKTNVSSGFLLLQDGESSGNWVSPTRSEAKNISECYLIAIGETLTGLTFEVSGNDGVNYQTITNKSKITLTTALGPNLKIKVSFDDADSQLDSLSIQYKLA